MTIACTLACGQPANDASTTDTGSGPPPPVASPTPQPPPATLTPNPQAELVKAALAELKTESLSPTAPDVPGPNSYASEGELNIGRIIEKIILLGPSASETVGKEAPEAGGDYRKMLDMVSARLGDSAALDRVGGYLSETESPTVRFCAASTLRLVRDKRSVPALETALHDPYRRKDGSSPPTTSDGMVYPVRMAAAEALIELGNDPKDVWPLARGEEPK